MGRTPSPRGDSRRDRSRSRSRSPYRSRSRSPRARSLVKDSISVTSEDAAFVCGINGQCKRKLEHVSGARLDIDQNDHKIYLSGTQLQVDRAKDYIGYVMQQRQGPKDKVTIDATRFRDDLSIVDVPEDCVGFIMGRGGSVLRGIEEEWGTLMFFALVNGGKYSGQEKLAIFGDRRPRRASELKVMSGVEHKKPGHFVDQDECTLKHSMLQPGDEDDDGSGWGVSMLKLGRDDLSYALGSQGSTRKKLSHASGCILEYLNYCAVAAGTAKERERASSYLKWLLMQRTGPVRVDWRDRDDVTRVKVPRECVGYITGSRGASLRETERKSGTFCFINDSDGKRGAESEDLLIFGCDKRARGHAAEMVEDMIRLHGNKGRGGYDDRDRGYGGGGGDRDRGYGGGGDRRDRDRRSRSRSPRGYRSRSRSPRRRDDDRRRR